MLEKILGKKKKSKKVEEVVEEIVETNEETTPEVTETPVAESTEVKFRSSGHTKLYAKLDPESRFAKNMVRRYGK